MNFDTILTSFIQSAKTTQENSYSPGFIKSLQDAGLPRPSFEFAFWPGRNFRIDIAFPEYKIAGEREGRGHNNYKRYHRDIEKYNQLAIEGWRLIRWLPSWETNGKALALLTKALTNAGW